MGRTEPLEGIVIAIDRSFDFTSPFASERRCCAQDDNEIFKGGLPRGFVAATLAELRSAGQMGHLPLRNP